MNIRDAFATQGPTCAALGSTFMGRLMPLIGTRLERGSRVSDRLLDWPGDTSASGDSVPLRLAGALHGLKIEGLALTDVYPPNNVDDDTLWDAIAETLVKFETRILHWLDSPPQTNEIRRAAVVLPALARVATLFTSPIELLELGTSAGLNLRCDHFWLHLPGGGLGAPDSPVQIAPEWSGTTPMGPLPSIIKRAGVDLNPLDPKRVEDRLRLLAYTWPDQPDRISRTKAAFEIASAVPAEIVCGDAAEWTEYALSTPAPDRVRILFHTIAWQYFPEETKSRVLTTMKATPSPLVQIAMEADGGQGAAVTLTKWPDGETITLGRASFHGLWVKWAG